MKPTYYIWVILLLLKSAVTSGQTCDSMSVCDCATKDLSPSGIMLGHEHGKGTWKFSYRYMNTISENNLSGTEKVTDNYVFNNYIMSPKNMRMDMHMVMAMYGITNKFSVMAMFNYNVMSMNMNMLPGTMTMHMDGGTMIMAPSTSNTMQSRSSGLGDTKLYLVYTLLNHNEHHILLSEGFNIPTGSIHVNGRSDDMMYAEMRLPYMMQMGSGSFDFMPGITYLLKANKTSFSTQVTSVIRPFNNSLNYHLGNELTLNAWVAHKWFPWISTSLRAEADFVGAISGFDPSLTTNTEPDANPLCYGGQYINTYIGLNFYCNKGWMKNNKLSVEYGIPVYQNVNGQIVNGTQLAVKSILTAGWMITF